MAQESTDDSLPIRIQWSILFDHSDMWEICTYETKSNEKRKSKKHRDINLINENFRAS